jgi:predicted site-specific integrase-resolvase
MMTNRHHLPPNMTDPEFSDFYGVSLRVVKRWAAEGRLPALELPGGLVRRRREDVLALGGYSSDPVHRPTFARRPARP